MSGCIKVKSRVVAVILIVFAVIGSISVRSSYAASPCTGVVLQPGSNIQEAVNSNPPGTTFCLKTGIYKNQSITPKQGNKFIGEPGTVLDGTKTTQMAFTFSEGINDVLVSTMTVTNYVPARQQAAVNPYNNKGWIIENCEIMYNDNFGVRIGDGAIVRNNKIHHNGVGGYVSSVSSGVSATDSVFENNELAYNNTSGDDFTGTHGEGGGGKAVLTYRLTIRNNHSHHNDGPGIWLDIDNRDSIVEDNLVEHNTGAGIMFEISYGAKIRNNIVRNNGTSPRVQGGVYGAGILISHSPRVEVYGNTLTGNNSSIHAIQTDRGSGGYGRYEVRDLYVHDNTSSGGPSGLNQHEGNDRYFTEYNNRFQNNKYTGPHVWRWMNADRTWAQWQGYGQDTTGSHILNPTPDITGIACTGLQGDGNGDNKVTLADYESWRRSFKLQ